MTAGHPCADHLCDHCYCCDVVGVCCQRLSAAQCAQLEDHDQAGRERARVAVHLEAGNVSSLGELVLADFERQRPAKLLPAAEEVPADHRKEAIRVLVARTTR